MSELGQLQKNLQAHLLVDDTKIIQQITGTTPENIAIRLAVYSNGYRWRLLEVLENDYLILSKLLGETAFQELAYAYIEAYPSHYFSVDLFAQHLPQFLAETKPYSEQAYLSELAHFILALNNTIDAADAPVLTTAELTAVPQENWPDMVIDVHPSVQLLTHHWNIVALWQAGNDDQVFPAAIRLEQMGHLVVWRKDIQSFYYVLDEKDAWVMQALQQGQSFGDICEGLLQWLPEEEVATHAVNVLLRWLNDGMLSKVKINS